MTRSNSGLRLECLHERHSGLTPALGETFSEAAYVCLDRHHSSPTDFEISSDQTATTYQVEFAKPAPLVLGAYANEIDTTETGAYGMCLAALEVREQMVAIRRAEKLTGADWYVAPIGSDAGDLENCFRLEVSGLDAGNRSAIETRLLQKINQTKRGASNLPAIAAVVGFKERVLTIRGNRNIWLICQVHRGSILLHTGRTDCLKGFPLANIPSVRYCSFFLTRKIKYE